MGTGGHNVPLICTTSGEIRKLTPKETFNVQGYPKDYKLPEDVSNGQLYKQAGNSVVVPVITRIAENISLALDGVYIQRSKTKMFSGYSIIYTKMQSRFEGESYVKEVVETLEQAKNCIKNYDIKLPILTSEEYLKLVKKGGNLEFYSIVEI